MQDTCLREGNGQEKVTAVLFSEILKQIILLATVVFSLTGNVLKRAFSKLWNVCNIDKT